MTINIFGGEWRETTDKELEEREREERAKARRACLEKFDEQMDEILLVNGWIDSCVKNGKALNGRLEELRENGH
jgi:hypothetical protein